MATLAATTIAGRLAVSTAPAAATDVPRKTELDAGLAGKSALGHTHALADVDGASELAADVAGKAEASHQHPLTDLQNLTPDLITLLCTLLTDTGGLYWEAVMSPSGLAGRVRLKISGGLLQTSSGLELDLSLVSQPGHTHPASDLEDLLAALSGLPGLLGDSDTISWDGATPSVRVKGGNPLTADADGLAVALGTGALAAAAGDHTHAQLHDPMEFQATASISGVQDGQSIAAHIVAKPAGGVLVGDAGLELDFGTGTNQPARGDHTHEIIAPAVASSHTLALHYSAQTGDDLIPPATLYTSGSGNYSHVITGLTVGATYAFVLGNAVSLFRLDGFTVVESYTTDTTFTAGGTIYYLSGGTYEGGEPAPPKVITAEVAPLVEATALTGDVRLDANPGSGKAVLSSGVNGLYLELGTDAAHAAAGDHTHLAATSGLDGFLSAADKRALDALATAGIVEDGFRMELSGSPLAAQVTYLVVPYAATLTGWDLVANATGGVILSVARATWANFPTATELTTADRPTLTSGQRAARNLTLTTWTTGLAAGDVLVVTVNSAATATRAVLNLRLNRV